MPGSVSFATNTRTFIQPPGPSEISDDSDEGSNCPENMASWGAHNIEEDYLIKKYDESSKSKGKFPENMVPHEALKEREDYENNAVLYRKLYLKTRPTVKETETFWKLSEVKLYNKLVEHELHRCVWKQEILSNSKLMF